MNKFYIEKVIAVRNDGDESYVSFDPGLNIIQGRSNTGKSCVVRCISYGFGSSTKPFDESLGYNKVILELNTPKGHITISRRIGKNQVEVACDVEGFEDGLYDIAPNEKKKKQLPILNDLLLHSMGIEDAPMVVKNKYFHRNRLTVKTMLNMLIFDENAIALRTSIIEPVQYTEKTYFLSTLLFLLTGRDFAESDAQTKKEIRDARKNAVQDYVNQKISGASNRKKELQEQLNVFSDIDIEKEMQSIINDIKDTENKITAAVHQSKELLSEIVVFQERDAESNLLHSRYGALKSQYVADIKRLTFIVNGEVELNHTPQNHTCPFCEGEIATRNRKSYIDSANAELSRIILQLNGLEETEQDLIKEKTEIRSTLSSLLQQKDDIESLINEELQPKAERLKESLNGYRAYLQIKSEMNVIADFATSWEVDLRSLTDEDESKLEYHPKEYFDKDFQERMDSYLKMGLEEACYDNLTTARFNLKDFDVEINGHKKPDIHGKGYCSFINSVVAIVFRKYLSEHAIYDPGFAVIDTPLLGLDQGVEDATPESMRTGLFRFFMEYQKYGQIIILENLQNIPDIDYKASGAKVITFTKGLSEGRYGFLNDVN